MRDDHYQPPYHITPAMLDAIERIGEALGGLGAAGDLVLPQMRRGNRIRTIQASLQIEGNSLGPEQVTAVLEGKRVLGLPRELQEVRNAFAAYERLSQWCPTSKADLLQAHALLMAGLVDDPGRFRAGGAGIRRGQDLVHIAPPAGRVPDLIDGLLEWLDKTREHPLVAGCVFHYEFEFIHPFSDGNGRLGRLWQTLILTRWRPTFAQVPVESVVRDRQSEYYAALGQADKSAQATAFVQFMLDAILRALLETQETLDAGDQDSDQDNDQDNDHVRRLLHCLKNGPRSASALMAALGLTHRPSFRKSYLHPALQAGLIEMTHPLRPSSRNQRYRLTPKGQQATRQPD